jgi:hypothetical protein
MSFDGSDSRLLLRIAEANEKSAATQEKLAEAFMRVATALEALTQEVVALREESRPNFDKQKLSAPKTSST